MTFAGQRDGEIDRPPGASGAGDVGEDGSGAAASTDVPALAGNAYPPPPPPKQKEALEWFLGDAPCKEPASASRIPHKAGIRFQSLPKR